MQTLFIAESMEFFSFRVEIESDEVRVFPFEFETSSYVEMPTHTYKHRRVFIGNSFKCLLTKQTRYYGAEFDGNSVLIEMPDNTYILIAGCEIVSFQPRSPIQSFMSPIGRDGSSYPYAIDDQGRYYLFTESVVIRSVPKKYHNNPHHYYWRAALITRDASTRSKAGKPLIKNFQGIKKFFINGDQYNMTYVSNPGQDYDDMLEDEMAENGRNYVRVEVEYVDGTRVPITREYYIDTICQFGNAIGLEPLVTKLIYDIEDLDGDE